MTPDELRSIRESLGLTQAQMAARLGFAPGQSGRVQVARMEAGERAITPRTERLVRALVTSPFHTDPRPDEGVSP